MLRWLLEKGFHLEQIKSYCKTNYTLEELINNKDIQIDNLIKREILIEMYKFENY